MNAKCTVLCAALCFILPFTQSGCSTMRYGGAPEPSYDIDADLAALAAEFKQSDSITKFYSAPSKEARDKFVVARLTMINIRYIQFVRTLTSERQLLDSASAILVLGLNLAGTGVSGAATKTILSAISAGITGSKEIVDKNYYFEKTIPALVGQMNAERKKALVPIVSGMRQNLDDYPFAQAVSDLQNYYAAGTFSGAIEAIQAEAGAKEQRQDAIIATLKPVSETTRALKGKLTDAIAGLKSDDLPKVQAAIKALDPDVSVSSAFEDAKNQLQGYVRGARTEPRIAEVAQAFKDAGITVQE